jgi:hypothetical protein
MAKHQRPAREPLRLREAWRAVTREQCARVAPLLLLLSFLLVGGVPAASAGKPDWDQVANIKEAATRLAQMQRTQGATRTFAFIDACYKTQSLNSNYTKAFEACIAQDYLETQVLALIYSRLPPETLQKLGAPTPELLAETMGKRIETAFATYDVPAERVQAFKQLVDQHGFPVFFKALFPGVDMPVPKHGLPSRNQKKQQ